MTDEGRRICTKGRLWELHIHSNQCYSADKELAKLSIPDYVTELINLLEDYDDLDMISFTDHNHICMDLYREFYERKSRFVLLPGIEVDTCLVRDGDKKDSRHIIVYFDAIDDSEKLEKVVTEVNQFMVDNHVGVQRKNEKPIYIHDLLDKLVSLRVQFVLSPHAMKQGKRDIDKDWHSMEEAERRGEMKKYLDQFFCFWESSGTNQIHHATGFLRDMDCGDKISIVAFSDSKNFIKLRQYLNQPCQYFNALPNFNGLKMVGSEITRISREQYCIESTNRGRYIGKVHFGNQSIELTPRLNAIIGGRGSGKSILLDAIANYLEPHKDRLGDDRVDFINTFSIDLTSMSGIRIGPGQLSFDYYNQSYIAKLFQKHGEAFNNEIESYFRYAFQHVEQIGMARIKRENNEDFESRFVAEQAYTHGNLEGFIEKYVIDHKDTLAIAILDKNRKKPDAKLAGFDYASTIEAIDKVLRPKIPAFLREDEDVLEAKMHLFQTICAKAFEERMAYLGSDYLFNTITDTFKQKKASINKAQKNRAEAISLFQAMFEDKALRYRQRVALINAFIGASRGFETHHEKKYQTRGEKEAAFIFKRELDVEHPLEYVGRLFAEQMMTDRQIGKCNLNNLWSYVLKFCYEDNCYKQGFSADSLFKALVDYELKYNERLAIYYQQDNGEYVDISKLSPGTQTNILIEYIVHQDTDIPLLIDQPEDNVDNQTIYSKIRSWFMTLKTMRQVIVVTHDANIVINADADNIILANQKSDGTFEYEWGALEYGKMLDNASLILDGGKDAVKRRLVKYGEQ